MKIKAGRLHFFLSSTISKISFACWCLEKFAKKNVQKCTCGYKWVKLIYLRIILENPFLGASEDKMKIKAGRLHFFLSGSVQFLHIRELVDGKYILRVAISPEDIFWPTNTMQCISQLLMSTSHTLHMESVP